MRQFRTSTDSVFDIDDDEGTRDVIVAQAGPPAVERNVAPRDAEPSGTPQDA